jgi:hypothetical protein
MFYCNTLISTQTLPHFSQLRSRGRYMRISSPPPLVHYIYVCVCVCACISFWLISFYLWLVLVFLFNRRYYGFTPLWHQMSWHYMSQQQMERKFLKTKHHPSTSIVGTLSRTTSDSWWNSFILLGFHSSTISYCTCALIGKKIEMTILWGFQRYHYKQFHKLHKLNKII